MECPKCRSAMTSYERGGVIVDQCSGCRGIFLDRGELERLIDLEAGAVRPGQADPQWTGPAPQRDWRQQAPQQRPWDRRDDWDDDSDRHHRSHGSHGSHKKKRKSMLSDLLDFG